MGRVSRERMMWYPPSYYERAERLKWGPEEARCAEDSLRRMGRQNRGTPLEGFRHAKVHYSGFDPVEVTRVLLEFIGGKDALSVTEAGTRGRPRKVNYNRFIVMMMNLWMPPWAEPKNRTQAKRRREVVAAPVSGTPRIVTPDVRRQLTREELVAELWVVWPVPKEAAPKRVHAAEVVTIALAEAGCIGEPHDEADFTRARKRVEEVYRRWYGNAWLKSPDAEIEALQRWVASMVGAQRPGDIYRRLQRWAPASLLRGLRP